MTSHTLPALLVGALASAAAAHGGGDYSGPGDVIPPGHLPSMYGHNYRLKDISHDRAAPRLPKTPLGERRWRRRPQQPPPRWRTWWEHREAALLRVREMATTSHPHADGFYLGHVKKVRAVIGATPRDVDRIRVTAQEMLGRERNAGGDPRLIAALERIVAATHPHQSTIAELSRQLRKDAANTAEGLAATPRLSYHACQNVSAAERRVAFDSLWAASTTATPTVEAACLLGLARVLCAVPPDETWRTSSKRRLSERLSRELRRPRPDLRPTIAAGAALALAQLHRDDRDFDRRAAITRLRNARAIHNDALLDRCCLMAIAQLHHPDGHRLLEQALLGKEHAWAALALGLQTRITTAHHGGPAAQLPDTVLERAGDPTQPDRGAYLIALGLVAHGSHTATLRLALEEATSGRTRADAAIGLAMHGDQEHIAAIRDQLAAARRCPDIVRSLTRALAALDDKASAANLIERVVPANEEIGEDVAARHIAIRALGEVGSRDAIEPLLSLLQDPDAPATLRCTSAHSLARLVQPGNGPTREDAAGLLAPFFTNATIRPR